MPWVAPITGYVDSLGYLFCCDCIGDRPKEQVVYGDNSAFHGFRCDGCKWAFPEIRTKDFVRVEHGMPAPDFQKPPRLAAE